MPLRFSVKAIFYSIALFYAVNPAICQPDYTFKSFSVEEGLSNASVNKLFKDEYGLFWIGTRDGLDRYNGHDFRHYYHDKGNPKSLSDNYIFDLIQYGRDSLFIATDNGIDIYRYSSDDFHHVHVANEEPYTAIHFEVDTQNKLWATTSIGLLKIEKDSIYHFQADSLDPWSLDESYLQDIVFYKNKAFISSYFSLNLLDIATGKFSNKNNSENPVFHLSDTPIYKMKLTSDGYIWYGIVVDDGVGSYLVRVNPETLEYTLYPQGAKGLGVFYAILTIEELPSGQILFGTNGGGIYLYQPDEDTFYHYNHNPKDEGTVNDIDIWDLYVDDREVLWVGTDGGGVNWSHKVLNRFSTERNNPFDDHSLQLNDVHSFFETAEHLWVGVNGLGGISKLDKNSGKYFNYKFDQNEKYSLWDNTVYALTGDDNGSVWVGSYSGGISKLNQETNLFTQHLININNRTVIPSNYTSDLIAVDSFVYVGSGNGLWRINIHHNRWDHFPRVPTEYGFGDIINDLSVDKNGLIWCGSQEGLFSFDPHTYQFDSLGTELDSIRINHLTYENNRLLVSSSRGLYRVEEGQVQLVLRRSDGLLSDNVLGAVFDQRDRIWLMTNKGLNSYAPSGQIQSYFIGDGLQGNQYNVGAIYKGLEGRVYLGGLNGYSSFDPDDIYPFKNESHTLFESYELQKKDLNYTFSLIGLDQISLNYDDDLLTLFISSDQIIGSEKTNYQYRIRELSGNNWIPTNNELVFTDLKTGIYTLDVRSSNYDGIWGKPTSLTIRIKPPFWASGWAYISYVLLFIGAIVTRDRKIKRDKIRLEKIVTERTSEVNQQAEKIKELDKIKTRFFSNISHEFRTPLTLIQGPILSIIQGKTKDPAQVERNLKVANRNVDTLRSLIDEILEFNKLETGNLNINHIPVHVKDYFEELDNSYRLLTEEQGVFWEMNLSFEPTLRIILAADQVQKIVHNLVSNAFKYSSSGDKIRLDVTYQDDHLIVSVTDQAGGIPSEELDKIFERFYQTSHGQLQPHSTGIGLAYVKEITHALGGEISVESEYGKGSKFSLKLKADQFISPSGPHKVKEVVENLERPHQRYAYPNNKILVVEDNIEMADYIAQVLGDEFQVMRQSNGQEALEVMDSYNPDLVITDIMMPVMDGLELLEKIKSDPKWRLKSMMMLTAKSSYETRLEALSFGLDDYLTKPFSPMELEIRVRNILQNQFERMSYLSADNETEFSNDPIINDLIEQIELNIANRNFGVLNLSEKAALSDRQLTRVVKKTTGLTPANLIKEVKLRKAKSGLESKSFRTVSEVANSVGFEKSSYFSKVFFERYGKMPSEYI